MIFFTIHHFHHHHHPSGFTSTTQPSPGFADSCIEWLCHSRLPSTATACARTDTDSCPRTAAPEQTRSDQRVVTIFPEFRHHFRHVLNTCAYPHDSTHKEVFGKARQGGSCRAFSSLIYSSLRPCSPFSRLLSASLIASFHLNPIASRSSASDRLYPTNAQPTQPFWVGHLQKTAS